LLAFVGESPNLWDFWEAEQLECNVVKFSKDSTQVLSFMNYNL